MKIGEPTIQTSEILRTRSRGDIIRGTVAATAAALAVVGYGLHQPAPAEAATKPVKCGPSTPLPRLPILSRGMKGSCVSYYQSLLARHGYMPTSHIDGVFGDETVGRTTGFQIQNNLKGTDGSLGTGNAGPLTWNAVRKTTSAHTVPAVCRAMVRGACASKNDNSLRLMKNGRVVRTFAVGFGAEAPDTRSDEGVYRVTRQVEHDHSTQFNGAPMDYATYYHGGEAIHSGDVSTASHGCIHASEPDAYRSYKFLQPGDQVVVY